MSVCNLYFLASENPERETYAFITHISDVDGFIFKSHFLPHSPTQRHYKIDHWGLAGLPQHALGICPGLGAEPPSELLRPCGASAGGIVHDATHLVGPHSFIYKNTLKIGIRGTTLESSRKNSALKLAFALMPVFTEMSWI